MIPIRLRHKISRRGLGYTAFKLKDTQAGQKVANWISHTLICQEVHPKDVEIRIGTGRWTAMKQEEKK